ncbi:hypothetical protein B5M09_008655 [Aphanomyces astaci]|uniref:CCHC-type domain-containing protein n=1 Tax=Aphanomyces astaci TaxID=112090 RepID=A0A425D9E1_APHAT|nr:hypothetical protein B5M09_008655 [Aphanomyces astaci]
MLDGLAAAICRDRQEWVIKEESPAIVKIITDAVEPVSLHRAVTEQMALTRNKPLKKGVYPTATTPQAPPGLTSANGCLKCKSTSHRVRECPGITEEEAVKHLKAHDEPSVVDGATVIVGEGTVDVEMDIVWP